MKKISHSNKKTLNCLFSLLLILSILFSSIPPLPVFAHNSDFLGVNDIEAEKNNQDNALQDKADENIVADGNRFKIEFENGIHYVNDSKYPGEPITLFCMNNLLHWPHTTGQINKVPDYLEGYLKPEDFNSPKEYNDCMRKLEKLLYAGYPYNGKKLYKIVDNVDNYIPTEEQFNEMLITSPELKTAFPYLGNHRFTLQDENNEEYMTILINFIQDVFLLHDGDTTKNNLTYSDIVSMPFYKAAYCLVNSSQESVLERFALLYPGRYFVTKSQAYDSTQMALYKLLNDYGVADNDIDDLSTFELGKILLQYAESDAPFMNYEPNNDEIEIQGDSTFTYNPQDRMWYSGVLKINEPEEYNGLYNLELQEGFTVKSVASTYDNIKHVYGNEEFILVSDKRPTDEKNFKITSEFYYSKELRQYSPSENISFDGKSFQNMVGSVVRKKAISFSKDYNADKTGDLEVTKTVVGDEYDKTREFTFVVTLPEHKINGSYGDMEFVNGVSTFTLQDGERKKALYLPAGAKYEVVENDNDGYIVTSTGSTGNIKNNETIQVSFTNKTETQMSISKLWNDNNDQDGIRPDNIEVQLYADGETYESVVNLDVNNNWTYTWASLPKFKDGKEISYEVKEVNVPNGYTSKVEKNDGGNFILINSHDPATVNKIVNKLWNDNNNQDGIRPDSIQVQLFADGETIASIKLDSKNNWTHTWTALPKFKDGKEISYEVKEVNVPNGYTSKIEKNDDGNFIITNSHTPDTVDKAVNKLWNDNNDQDGIRPDSIEVQLYANGEAIGSIVNLDNNNKWTYTWTALPKFKDGKEISYKVKEVNVPNGYTSKVEKNDDGNFILTNSHTPDTVDKAVNKLWNDNNDQDGIRPDSVQVQLYANGEAIGSIKLDGKNNWRYTWTSLPKFKDGKEISYEVKEVNVPNGYTSKIEKNDDGNFIITNNHTPDTVDKAVNKLWNDNSDQDGIRPDSIEVQLYANGEAIGSIVKLDDKNNWRYTWTSLPKFKDGKEISYEVKEVNIPNGYTSKIEKNDDGNFILTNSHDPATVNKIVNKLWNDNNNQDGIRPDSIQVQLYANEEAIGSIVNLDNNNKWTYTWASLPKFKDGKEISYEVKEVAIPNGYTSKIEKNDDENFTITNSHDPDTVDKKTNNPSKPQNNDNLSNGTGGTLQQTGDYNNIVLLVTILISSSVFVVLLGKKLKINRNKE